MPSDTERSEPINFPDYCLWSEPVPRKGERGPLTKITMGQAREIRHRYATERISLAALAMQYGISQNRVSQIIHGKSWKDDQD